MASPNASTAATTIPTTISRTARRIASGASANAAVFPRLSQMTAARDVLDQPEGHADRGGREAPVPALVVAEPAGDQRAREGADVDRHVVERETGVPAFVVGAVELADHGGHVGLEQAGPGADEAEAAPGHRGGGHRHRVVPAGDEDAAPEHRAVRAEDAVGEPAARDRDEIDQRSVGCRHGCGRSGRHAHAAVRDGIREVEDEDGLHAEEREPLPDLEPGEREQAPGLAEEGVVVLGRRFAVGLGFERGRDTIHYFRVSR